MLIRKLKQRLKSTALLAVASFIIICDAVCGKENESLEILFIGNSYTGRHNLSKVVEAMAEAGNPGLEVNVSTVIYGGRRLIDHWRLGTANFVRSQKVGVSEIEKTIASLEKAVAENPKDNHAKSAIKRNQEFLDNLDTWRKKWERVWDDVKYCSERCRRNKQKALTKATS